MARTIAARIGHHQDNSLDLPLIGAAPARSGSQQTVNSVDDAWILPLVQRAVERTIGHKAAAISAGMDKGQWSRQLSGDGHLSVRRLGLLGEDFWLALMDELRAHFHLDDDADRLDRALDAVTSGMKVIGEIAKKNVKR